MKLSKNRSLFFLLLIFACQNDPAVLVKETDTAAQEVPKTLPMSTLSLNDLSAFQSTSQNWQIAGEIYADWQTDQSLELTDGAGILVNKPTPEAKGNIRTTWEHGDLDLEIDFLVPKGSNSGIYLQGRYELQILDSWGKEAVTSSDCGGIYQRWDDTQPEGKKGFEGNKVGFVSNRI